MRAFVSDQSSSFNAVDIGTAPDSTIVASLKLPPGSWVVFATVALGAATSTPGTTTVQMFFQLDPHHRVGGRKRGSGPLRGVQQAERCKLRICDTLDLKEAKALLDELA